jgi:riboflavin kinase / FMN adenylyltransferase
MGAADPSTRRRPHLLVHLGLPTSHVGAVALTVGSFDGVHLGHVDVIHHVIDAAKASDAQPALITFEPHPRCVLDPANCPQSITTLQEKLALIEAAGIEHAIVLRFDRELASLSPQEFVDRLATVMDLRRWVIGYDFAFGRGRTGSAHWLREHGQQVDVVPPFKFEGRELHSSEVRRLITAGEVDQANRLLGREYAMAGPVEAGEKVGRQLGFPTANIAVEPNKLIPALGAYAGRARIFPSPPRGAISESHPPRASAQGRGEGLKPATKGGVNFIAALSVGYRPTFGGTQLRVEAFLLDFEGDLYQQRLELRFVRYLHPDIKFPTTDDLVRQLHQDVADTRRLAGR